MMKLHPLATATALALAASLALAQQEPPKPPVEATEQNQPGQAQVQHHPPAAPMIFPLQQRLEEMQALVERMSQTTDPAERQKLVQEHRQKMQELAGIMRNLPGGPMAGHDKMGGEPGMMGGMHGMGGEPGMMGGGRDKAGGMSCMIGESHHKMMDLMAAYQQMDKRLDLMQRLLEKILEEKQD